MWKVNASRRSVFAREFVDRGVVAIGWRDLGDYSVVQGRDDIDRRMAVACPDDTERQRAVASAQIWRFLSEVRLGDRVITYDPDERVYHLGKVTGTPRYEPDQIEELPMQRAVEWSDKVSRDALSTAAKGKLGALLTLFKVAQTTAEEIEGLAGGERPLLTNAIPPAVAADVIEAADPFADLEDHAIERIKDKLRQLGWSDMQEIVAALLRAMGYRTIVSLAGPDRGKDIVASRDGFGFEPPRIVVEVKHRRGPMGAPEIRAFLGGRHVEDRGLYVSTGGFSREAYFEAERASNFTHLMTLDGLARALIENYERVDDRGRALLPLMKLYWLA